MAKRKKFNISAENRLKLTESVNWLISDAQLYDKGNFNAIKRSSVIIRTLFHDTQLSHSLIGQIEKDKDHLNFNVSNRKIEHNEIIYYGSIFVAIFDFPYLSDGNYYNTYLFDPEHHNANRTINFSTWWNDTVLKVLNTNFTRKKLILTIANQDGGAHYDPNLNSNYLNIINGSTGFNIIVSSSDLSILGISNYSKENVVFEDAHLALMRQIVHETIITLIKHYNLDISYDPELSYNQSKALNEIQFQISATK